MKTTLKNFAEENGTLLLVAIGGALITTLIGYLISNEKETEPFPLSPVNEPNNQRGVSTFPSNAASAYPANAESTSNKKTVMAGNRN